MATTYFIDPGAGGNDADDGLSTANAWKTLAKYTTTTVRTVGDNVICRNGSASTLGAANLGFDEDGTLLLPIIIEADYADAFGDDVDLSLTASATLAFGSKAVIFSAPIASVIAIGDVIYVAAEVAKDFSYEVAASQASDSGTDDGADPNKLIDTGKFGSTVLGTEVVNTTDSITGHVSILVSSNEVEVTVDGRRADKGGTVVVFDNGDTFTIADQAVLFLPYKGDQAGSSKTMTNIQSKPLWNTVAGNFNWLPDNDNHWYIQGIAIRGTDPGGTVDVDSGVGWVFKDCTFQMNGNADSGISISDNDTFMRIHKCRFLNYGEGIKTTSAAGAQFIVSDSLFDGNSAAGSEGYNLNFGMRIPTTETEFRNHGEADIRYVINSASQVQTRNCIFASTKEQSSQNDNATQMGRGFFEDYNGVLGETREYGFLDSAEDVPIMQSNSVTVRSGGSAQSIEVTPSTSLSVANEFGRFLLFEIPIWATTASKKYEIFFRPDATANWTADPTNTELWIELEAWGDATNNFRKITKSTGVIDMNGSTTFTALDVTVAPAQEGVAYLRCYYAKPKESTKTNVFLCDPIPVIT